jgi:hypothetical protein
MTKSIKTATTRVRRPRAPKFVLSSPAAADLHHRCSTAGLFGGNAFFLGGGDENYKFQSLQGLVNAAMADADSAEFELPEVRLTKNKHYEVDLSVLRQLDPMAFPIPKMVRFVRADAPKAIVSDERELAHDFANVMIDGLFTQPVHQFFEQDFKTLIQDKHLLRPEYWEIADSLKDQLVPAQEQVVQALPMVMSELRKRYPEASTGQLYQGALQLIGRQLAPILSTVQLWTTGFRQSLDPKLTETLRLVRAVIESNLFLTLTGNLKIDEIDKASDIKQAFPTIKVSVGDVVLPVLIGAFDSGPAVIPMATGALGPRGGHLAFVPWNLIEVLPFIIAIYMHETGHLLQGVIEKFMETYAALGGQTITKKVADGSLIFDEPFVMIGAQKIPAADFWTMVFQGQLPEQDADNWGMRSSGPGAFGRCFINYVGAMTEVSVGSMDKVDHTLRMGSSYTVKQTADGKVMIKLEPHPQDGPRIGSWQAAIADLMGFPDEAKYLRDYAARESGKDATRITWTGIVPQGDDDDSQGVQASGARSRKQPKAAPPKSSPTKGSSRSKKAPTQKAPTAPTAPQQPKLPVISASVADYDKVAKVVAEAYLNTKTACLNNMSLRELVCLTPEMQKSKVDLIKDLLKKGINTLPQDGHHYFFHTIGAAATNALFELKKEGLSAKDARVRVVAGAMGMMLELLPKWEADVQRLDVYKLKEADVQPKKVS